MASRYPTPRELVEALQQRGEGAREQLQALLRAPLARLMGELRDRHRLRPSGEMLTRFALHAAETYLRTRPAQTFAAMTWTAFRAAILLHVAKLASQPYGRSPGSTTAPAPLPRWPGYDSEALFQPHEQVGDYWFGGDWFGGLESDDGSLWVLVADITGHGYYAYLLASTLPSVWQTCWESAPTAPAELLASMHDLLADCLPEGVYVECTLARLRPAGEVVIVPAGGSRLLLRRGPQEKPILVKLRGAWLGLARPSRGDQRTWTLEEGGELLLATDGLFDQLHELGPSERAEWLGRIGGGGCLFERVRELLRQALARAPQKDDITMVLLRRRAAEPAASLPCVDLSSPNETGDVSV
jgi:serine phosphatase RsbU (regulator of sigma subunit)